MSSSLPDLRIVYEGQLDFVWRSLRRLGVREPDVMEETQRVFLAFYAQLPAQRDPREPREQPLQAASNGSRHGLFAICQQVAGDYRRATQPPVAQPPATQPPAAAPIVRPLTAAKAPDTSNRTGTAEWLLDKLPESQRSVFVLYELEDLPCEQIAGMLGISVGTVRTRLRLARERFGREVRQLHGDEPDDAEKPAEVSV